MEANEERYSTLDQFRVICTIMVIVLHFIGKGGVLDAPNINSAIGWTLKSFCTMAVNGFVILSSFFMLEKEFKLKRIFSLILQVWLVSVSAAMIVFLVEKQKNITLPVFLESLFPNLFAQYWFTTSYMGLCLLSPFINCMLKNLDDKKLNCLLIVLFCLFCLWPTIIPSSPGCDNSGGYSLLWFFTLYIVTAWLKRNYKKLQTIKRWMYLALFSCCGIFSVIVHYVASFFAQNVAQFFVIYTVNMFWYSTVPSLLSAFSLFMFFLTKSHKRKTIKCKYIWKKVAGSSLCIYLLQEQVLVRSVLWEKWLPIQKYIPTVKIWCVLLISICLIMSVGVLANEVLMFVQTKIEKGLFKYCFFKKMRRGDGA